ncbi:MarR family transcriptional regulator [Leptolyngbya sp. NK1-12]|uniref:MarR family transcriptional regulator n=1 Tax=Leptolyngbya sp. NK1-12 TaxID=2547451 RepID=A0AA96WCJ3_9CYAN|nr:MarR family transcriptional regulator [Leptolyngbya sp. NK1-12]
MMSDAQHQPDADTNLHYRLTHAEWLSNCKQLKYAELTLLYYLRTLNPFADRPLDLKIVDVAQTTGLSKGTVSKSLRSLKNKGFIDLELTGSEFA